MHRPRLKLISIPWELEVPTLGLASLAAVTPEDFDIAIVDLLRQQLFFDEDVDLVGISASTPRIKAAYALADLYRARGVKVVMGGHHVTAMSDEALAHCDAVVVGEGETSWRRLCDDFLVNPARVQGIYADPPPDLGELPQPRVDLLHIERYGSFYYPLIASRGCPEACTFCFAKRMTRGYRTYPISHVLEQVRRRPDFIKATYFVDDNLPADPDYSRELFAALEKTGIRFGMQARHEFSKDPDNLRRAKAAGCLLISSGYESVNQRSLDGNAKRANADGYREVIQNIFDVGIIPSGNWMFGFDTDTKDIFRDTLEFMVSTKLMHSSFTTEIPFPGTASWSRYRREGRLLTEDTDEYVGKDHVVVRPQGMSPDELRDGIRWLANEFYAFDRCTQRARMALANRAIEGFGPAALRGPALLGLNYYQWWQWHYRMVPSVQWLYQRLVSVNRYQYWRDFTRRTNYWASKHRPAGGPAHHSAHPFFAQQGFKRSHCEPMVAQREVQAPPRP
jgi:radical SAM superfamily enzyme YgiQ (UPF0313 family)